MQTDKSKITQEELRRNGITELDNLTITRFKLLLDKRIALNDFDFTTMSDAEWIRDFRKALVELMDTRDAKKQDCNISRQFLEAELDTDAEDEMFEGSQNVKRLQSDLGYLANLNKI